MSETYTLYVDGKRHSQHVDDLMIAKGGVLVIYYLNGDTAGIRNWEKFFLEPNEENDD